LRASATSTGFRQRAQGKKTMPAAGAVRRAFGGLTGGASSCSACDILSLLHEGNSTSTEAVGSEESLLN
jgi:hypothetical protein